MKTHSDKIEKFQPNCRTSFDNIVSPVQGGADDRESQRLALKRQVAQDRANRIHDEKQRLYGVDKDALRRQVEEKKKREQLATEELAEEREFIKKVQELEEKAQNDKLQGKARTRNFLQENEQLRELKEQRVRKARTDTFVPPDLEKAGPSSMIVFDGEDTKFDERKRQQQETIRRWAAETIEERKSLERQEQKIDQTMNERVALLVELSEHDKKIQDNNRRLKLLELAQQNRELSASKASQQQCSKKTNENHESQELQDTIYNSILLDGDIQQLQTRNPELYAREKRQPLSWAYKQMSPEDVQAIYEENRRLLEFKAERAAKETEANLAEIAIAQKRAMREDDQMRVEQEKKKAELEDLRKANEYLRERHKNKHLREKALYAGGINSSFLDAFGRSPR